jgi:hypothetical protein
MLVPEHQRLEDVVLAATTTGSDRFGLDGHPRPDDERDVVVL